MRSQTDPLYIIFEQHLCNFQDPEIDRKTFIAHIVSEYLTYLRKKNITVPRALEQLVIEELANQVNGMLVKRIYGSLTVQEFQKQVPTKQRRKARSRYNKI